MLSSSTPQAALTSGLEPELRPWHPHITLARCREISPAMLQKFLKENMDLDAGIVRVAAIHLYSSKLTPAGAIHTCELSGANSFDYLTELQRHAQELAANPADWMPWTYRETLQRLKA